MLPDYPIFKKALQEALTERFQQISKQSKYVISQIRESKIQEGQKSTLLREDGQPDEIQINRFGEEMIWKLNEIDKLTFQDVTDKLDAAARNMAMKKEKMTFEEIEKAVTKVGNAVSTKGEEFSPKHFFEVLSRIVIPFDEHNNPIYPTIVAGTQAFEGIKRVMSTIDNDAILKRQYLELIEKKRLEWREREAARTLVG